MSGDGTVIIGGGLAAVRTAEQLRRQGCTAPVTIAGAENRLPYDRPPLSKGFLRGAIADANDVALKPIEFYQQNRITLRLGVAARAVDPRTRTVALADGAVLGYEQLVIATGLVPRRIPTFPGLDGIHVLRSVDDSLALRRRAATTRRAVVVGGGFIGCEVSASLRALGIDVVLVEPQPTPLGGVLGERVGELVSRLHQSEGVDLRTGLGVAEVCGTSGVESVVLTDGSEVSADMVVVGIGSRPAVDWLADSGVEVSDGVVCDAVGRTSAPDVWALGDVASWRGQAGCQARVEHWSNVAEQAKAVAAAMLNLDPDLRVAVPYFWSDQYGVKIQCLGRPQAADTVHLVHDDGRKFLAYYERAGALVGVVGAGIAEQVRAARAEIAAGAHISALLEPAAV